MMCFQLIRQLGKCNTVTKYIEKYYHLETQEIGNCAFASFEATLWTLIAIEYAQANKPLTEAAELFKCLQFDWKLRFAKKYFNAHLKEDNPYLPDMILILQLFEQISPYQHLLLESYKKLSVHQAIPWKEPKEDSQLSSPMEILRAYYTHI